MVIPVFKYIVGLVVGLLLWILGGLYIAVIAIIISFSDDDDYGHDRGAGIFILISIFVVLVGVSFSIFAMVRAGMFISSLNAHHAGLKASQGQYACTASTQQDVEIGTVLEYSNESTSVMDEDM